jgi:predicted DNA-binding transcriptional regulator AlpA
MATIPSEELAIVRWTEVQPVIGLKSKSHVEKLEKEERFPESVKISERAKGWVRSEIQRWVKAKIAGCTEDQIKALVRRMVQERQLFVSEFDEAAA